MGNAHKILDGELADCLQDRGIGVREDDARNNGEAGREGVISLVWFW